MKAVKWRYRHLIVRAAQALYLGNRTVAEASSLTLLALLCSEAYGTQKRRKLKRLLK